MSSYNYTKKESTIFAPASSCKVDLCGGANDCPITIFNCDERCFSINACRPAIIPLDLGCNRETGVDLQSADVLALDLTFYYVEMEGCRVELATYNLVDDAAQFDGSGYNEFTFSLTPEQTSLFPEGRIMLEGYLTDGIGQYERWETPVCVSKPAYADPIICVSGEDGEGTPFTLANGVVTAYVHDSQTVHGTKRWDNFVFDWGDGNTFTLDATGIADQTDPALMQATYDYAPSGSGNYVLCVTGTLEYDETNPCDEELSQCVCLEICLNIL